MLRAAGAAARIVISFMLTTSVTSASLADQRSDTLIANWIHENTLCRGLPGDDPQSDAACKRRQIFGHELGQLGWCYGKHDQMAFQMQWHRCKADCARPK